MRLPCSTVRGSLYQRSHRHNLQRRRRRFRVCGQISRRCRASAGVGASAGSIGQVPSGWKVTLVVVVWRLTCDIVGSLNHVAEKAGKVCRNAMSALLTDAAAAASAARSTHDALSAVGSMRQDKIQPVAATITAVHDDAVALQLQVDAAYLLMCKVPPLHFLASQPLFISLGYPQASQQLCAGAVDFDLSALNGCYSAPSAVLFARRLM